MSIRLKSINCIINNQLDNYKDFHIDCDRKEFEQLFINLFNNAIYAIKQKHRTKGEIKITLRKMDKYLLIEFKDNGVGISSSDLPFIFDISFTTKRDGTGFGLPICQRVVKDHHSGEIYAKSNEGEYTTLFIKLPIKLL